MNPRSYKNEASSSAPQGDGHYNSDHTHSAPQPETAEQLSWERGYYLRMVVILIITNLVLIANSYGQLVSVNGAAITNTAQITVKGGVTAQSGASIANNGSMEVSGDLINNSGSNLFGTSSGEVDLNGGMQNIGGADVILFHHLTLSGTGAKTLLNDALTGGTAGTGVLTLDHQLILNTRELIVFNSSPTAIAANAGYIISETDASVGYGKVKWMIGNNTGNYTFPFGNSITSSYLPVSFNITTAGAGTNGFLSLATYPTLTSSAPNNRPLPTGLSSLMNHFGMENAANVADRWWVLDHNGYTTMPVSNVALTYRDSEWDASGGSTNIINEAALQAQSSDGSTWTSAPAGAVNTATNTVTITGNNVYKPFWTLVGNSDPLPLTLISFTAKPLNKKHAIIEWVTATELNNDFFTLERSKDGVTFEPIGIIDGAGTSNTTLNYHFIDEEPYGGLSYYRLMQTDFDGKTSYSEVRAVRFDDGTQTAFKVFPNPSNGQFNIMFDDENAPENISIYDMSGKLVRLLKSGETESLTQGVIKADCTDLPSGIYFVSANEGQMQKIVIQ
jgi:hypothetical protein